VLAVNSFACMGPGGMPRQQTPGEVGPGPFVESSLGEKQYVNPLTHAACRLALLLHGNLVAQAQGNALCLGTDAHKPLDVAIRLLLNADIGEGVLPK